MKNNNIKNIIDRFSYFYTFSNTPIIYDNFTYLYNEDLKCY